MVRAGAPSTPRAECDWSDVVADPFAAMMSFVRDTRILRTTRALLEDRFNWIPIGIDNESRIVGWSIMWAQTGSAIVNSSSSQSG